VGTLSAASYYLGENIGNGNKAIMSRFQQMQRGRNDGNNNKIDWF